MLEAKKIPEARSAPATKYFCGDRIDFNISFLVDVYQGALAHIHCRTLINLALSRFCDEGD